MAHDLLEDTELRHTKPYPIAIAFPYLYRSCTCDTVISALTSKDFSSEIGILQSFKDFFKEFHF